MPTMNEPVLINITYAGQSGNWFTHLDPGTTDQTIRCLCEETVRGGEVTGISPVIPANAFRDFVIDRFPAVDGHARFVVRPKVPFG